MRKYSLVDQLLIHLGQAIHLSQQPSNANRVNPALSIPEADLNAKEIDHIIGLMRVNHAGEIAAQGLYQGQALTAKLTDVKDQMLHAATEEIDHLAWCRERIEELGGHTSYLDPMWYLGALIIGATAGAVGDKWSLGFITETEKQVSEHLTSHLERLPSQDRKSELILKQMREDEEQHGEMAKEAGAVELPIWIKGLMRIASKIMVTVAYHW